MLRAGVSYSDWRQMSRFQRMDFLARRTIEREALVKKLQDAKKPNEILGVILSKIIGS